MASHGHSPARHDHPAEGPKDGVPCTGSATYVGILAGFPCDLFGLRQAGKGGPRRVDGLPPGQAGSAWFGRRAGGNQVTAPTIHRVPLADDIAKKLQRLSERAARTTVERDQLIAAAYRQGASMREIARAVGMTHPGVRNILIRDGIYDATRPDPSDE